MDTNAIKAAFQRRSQQGGAAPAGGGGASAPMQNPMQGLAAARSQGASNGNGSQDEALFILKVLAKRLAELPPHKPEKPVMQQSMGQPAQNA